MRYRIAGFLVLLCLAIVLGPLLFDGAGLSNARVPTLPDRSERTLEAVQAREEALRPDDLSIPARVPEADELEATAEELRAALDESGRVTTPVGDSRRGEAELRPLSDATRVFAIQVASFADQANASVLRERLRNAGYEAFLSEVLVGGRSLTRVAVGPYLDRTQANEDRITIGRRFDLETRLMAMLI